MNYKSNAWATCMFQPEKHFALDIWHFNFPMFSRELGNIKTLQSTHVSSYQKLKRYHLIPREFEDSVTEKSNHLQVTRLSLRRSPPCLVIDDTDILSAVTVWSVWGTPSQELPSSTLQGLTCKPKYPNKSGQHYHEI